MEEKDFIFINLAEDFTDFRGLFGNHDCFLKEIEEKLNVLISLRANNLKIIGNDEDRKRAKIVFEAMLKALKNNEKLDITKVSYFIDITLKEKNPKIDGYEKLLCYNCRGKAIKTKTIGQEKYVQASKSSDIVFAIGPAGTGKTYLAVALAVNSLKNNEVNRIILTRPAVEAGESLGFLPGDLKEKIDPYLKPLYDALYDILGMEAYERHMQRGSIEIAPLAYMRGRTLDNSFIILDEAQNTTPEQMKMFLTRMGFNSKTIVTGDVTQMDLPKGKKSGLIQVKSILKGVKGIEFIQLDENDVVRNNLVKRIIKAYEKYEEGIENQ